MKRRKMSGSIEEDSGDPKKARGYSHSETHSIIYTWEINQITSFLEPSEFAKESVFINSPEFSTSAKIKDLWLLQLKIWKDNKSWLSIYLHPLNGGTQKIRTKYYFFLLNNDNKEKLVKNFQVYQSSSEKFNYIFESSIIGHGYRQFSKIDELLQRKNKFFPNDTLTVGVSLTVYDDYIQTNDTVEPSTHSGLRLKDDFKKLLITKNKFDVIIKVDNEKFDAHKSILIARSSVFDAMFSHDMQENKKNKIIISDIDPEVFKRVLEYIYTDQVEELDNFAEELLEASDKYQLQGLEEMAENSLAKTLVDENAIRIIILADRHNAEKLKESAINYVVSNFIKLKCTEEFKALEQCHPSLFLIILKKYSNIETK